MEKKKSEKRQLCYNQQEDLQPRGNHNTLCGHMDVDNPRKEERGEWDVVKHPCFSSYVTSRNSRYEWASRTWRHNVPAKDEKNFSPVLMKQSLGSHLPVCRERQGLWSLLHVTTTADLSFCCYPPAGVINPLYHGVPRERAPAHTRALKTGGPFFHTHTWTSCRVDYAPARNALLACKQRSSQSISLRRLKQSNESPSLTRCLSRKHFRYQPDFVSTFSRKPIFPNSKRSQMMQLLNASFSYLEC